MLPMTVLRRFDCVLAPTKSKVLAEHERRQGGRLNDDAFDRILSNAAGQRFHNHSPLFTGGAGSGESDIRKWIIEYFYRYTPPRPLEEIDAELKQAEEEIMRLLREVTT